MNYFFFFFFSISLVFVDLIRCCCVLYTHPWKQRIGNCERIAPLNHESYGSGLEIYLCEATQKELIPSPYKWLCMASGNDVFWSCVLHICFTYNSQIRMKIKCVCVEKCGKDNKRMREKYSVHPSWYVKYKLTIIQQLFSDSFSSFINVYL